MLSRDVASLALTIVLMTCLPSVSCLVILVPGFVIAHRPPPKRLHVWRQLLVIERPELILVSVRWSILLIKLTLAW